MNYEEAVDYIEETPKFTSKNSLDHTRECLARLGNPQDKFHVIHVAGTNGKGSTCSYVASIMRESGKECGLFTSPHLVRINERFQINEEEVSNEVFLEAFLKVKSLAEELVAEGNYHPTYFEMLFLMGMVIFAGEGVDYVILETGLGGRLDATNSIAHPLACVITSISMDHMQYLGDTVEKIAWEKTGIIKGGIPVIYDANDPVTAEVIEDRAEEEGTFTYPVRDDASDILENTANGIVFSVKYGYDKDEIFNIPFIARYQVTNALLAITVVRVLSDKLQISLDNVRKGLARTRWQGRMETILPGVIVDGAHNEDGIRRFVETAEHFQKEYPLILLFSVVSDKDYEDMIKTICNKITFKKVIITEVGGYRRADPHKMAEIFCQMGCTEVEVIPIVGKAFDEGLKSRGEGLMFCVGSLYLIGDIKAHMKSKRLTKR